MNKLLSIKNHLSILLFAAVMVAFVSCGSDDDPLMDDSFVTVPPTPQPDNTPSGDKDEEQDVTPSFVEPFHDKNGSRDDIKAYMAENMPQFHIAPGMDLETGIRYEINSSSPFCVAYTFLGGKLASSAAHLPTNLWDEVVQYYKDNYELVESSSNDYGPSYTFSDKNGDKINILKNSLYLRIMYLLSFN